jgi:hypothetical protein
MSPEVAVDPRGGCGVPEILGATGFELRIILIMKGVPLIHPNHHSIVSRKLNPLVRL